MTYISQCLADGAVGLWVLGEASNASPAADQAGNSNGTYVNAPTVGQTGIAGGGGATAAKFATASSQTVTIPDVAAQHVGDTFTIETWAKLASLPGVFSNIFAAGNVSTPEVALISTGALGLSKGNGSSVVTSTSLLTVDGLFHHLAVTKTGATTKLYIDAVDVTGTVTNATMSNSTSWIIAASGYGSPSPFDGTLQFVGLYPTALSAATVANHHTLGIGGNPVVTTQPYDNSTAWTLLS